MITSIMNFSTNGIILILSVLEYYFIVYMHHILSSFIDSMGTLIYFITGYYEQVWDKRTYRNMYFSVCLY